LLQLATLEALKPHFDIDIVDWRRTKMQTITVDEALSANTKCDLTFDLMLDFPGLAVHRLVKDKRVQAIILNVSAQENLHDLIDFIHFYKVEAGLSVNPDTHFYQIVPYIPELDIIQIYTVEPGAQGNPYLPERLKLIKDIRQFGFKGKISIDGGINAGNIDTLFGLSVNIVSIGSAISQAADPQKVYQRLQKMARQG
jgi:pentose-5-phosphate-3-epimerase